MVKDKELNMGEILEKMVLQKTGPTQHGHVHLTVSKDGDNIIKFNLHKSLPLKKLMVAYCDRTGHLRDALDFHYDGKLILETDTPESLNMEEEDSIQSFART